MYRELKQLLREDAARRQHATRFSSEHQPGDDELVRTVREIFAHRRRPRSGLPAGGRDDPGGASITLDKIDYVEQPASAPTSSPCAHGSPTPSPS
ncbi:hypothetical protein [Arthrobacter sp.]|uniref:hypothetical protein n=1 Tax=Arthrobacter sp. TaxID=1667 RepID=UPI003A932A94